MPRRPPLGLWVGLVRLVCLWVACSACWLPPTASAEDAADAAENPASASVESGSAGDISDDGNDGDDGTDVDGITEADDGLGTHGFAQSGDVRIHYVTSGTGPLVVMIHGFPDYWYTWRGQMPALSEKFQVVAIDQRGYNRSDKPEGVEAYALDRLVADVAAVIRHVGHDRATVIGHDWGGMVAWRFAMVHPELTERLVVLNLPHPNGLIRELATNPEQRENSGYARFFQSPDAVHIVKPEALVAWVKDPAAREKHLAAMQRSSLEGMLNYYKANYPREPYTIPADSGPRVACPVLLIHGLKDKALLPAGLNDTWTWLDGELTLVTIPDADHFVQHDAADTVTRTIVRWLAD